MKLIEWTSYAYLQPTQKVSFLPSVYFFWIYINTSEYISTSKWVQAFIGLLIPQCAFRPSSQQTPWLSLAINVGKPNSDYVIQGDWRQNFRYFKWSLLTKFNHLRAASFRKFKYAFAILITFPHWICAGNGKPSSFKTKTRLPYMVNIIATDDLSKRATRSSATIVLTYCFSISILCINATLCYIKKTWPNYKTG